MTSATATRRRIRVLPRKARHDEALGVVEHLDELRKRIFVIIGALAVGFAIAYVFHGHLVHALDAMLPRGIRKPVTFGIAESFLTSLKVSFYSGLVLAVPVIMWQVWGFFAPVVHERKQRGVAGFVVLATVLAIAGLATGYFVVLPAAVHFLLGFDTNLYNIQIRAQDYLSFAVLVLVAMALVFELPVFVLGLVRFRVLSAARLRSTRRLGYAGCAVVAAALPGADAVSMLVEFGCLMALYELSIWLSVVFEPRWRRTDAKLGTSISEAVASRDWGYGLWGK